MYYAASPNGSQQPLGAHWIEFAKVVLTFQIALGWNNITVSGFNLRPWGNIVSNHYFSSLLKWLSPLCAVPLSGPMRLGALRHTSLELHQMYCAYKPPLSTASLPSDTWVILPTDFVEYSLQYPQRTDEPSAPIYLFRVRQCGTFGIKELAESRSFNLLSLRRRARGVARVAVGGEWSPPCPPLTSALFPWDGWWSICTYYSSTLRWHEMNHTCQSCLARGRPCLFISISGICDTAVDGARSLPLSLLLALATVQLAGEPWMHTRQININKRATRSRVMLFAYVASWGE